ncbi:mitochondrial ribonuclease P protein 1 homolog [Papilio machaon]|uniref:mitochondrial ribonuclease P protein 1 homolog n=1 Tax=Papilio machaon TaxID=76193 RepID=UPI001E663033|nr:mitochondrial ribonuclease P protein 1 homolog [Papilio machaon]
MQCIKSLISNIRQYQVSPILYKRVISVAKWKTPIRFYTVQDDDSDIINDLCKGDADLEKRLKILMLEVEVMRQDGRPAPSILRKHHWEHLLTLASRNQRSGYLVYLWKTQMSKENEKAKKEARRREMALKTDEVEEKEFPDDLMYGIKHQTLFLRIRDQSINQFDNYRALQAMMWGQPIVIDCSYEQNMVWREAVNAAKQMTLVFGDNRIHKEPFNIHMCNVDLEGHFMKQLRKNIPSLEEPWFPLNIHTKSYLDIFPKQKLVYLTPHCREELTTFDHDTVYIIGCMVDKINTEPLSLARAKRDGLKMAKLPLDRYMEWAPGANKSLNINHMVPILLDLKVSGDWDHALRHIPRRKLMETKIMAMQKRIGNSPLAKEEIFKNFNMIRNNRIQSFRNNRVKSKQSLLCDDDSI